MLRDWPVAVLTFLDVHNGLVTAIATIFIAAFTIVLAIVTRRQGLLTREAIKLARDEFNATHRPKLRVRRMRPHPTDCTPVGVQYAMVNVGETTAIIKRHELTATIYLTTLCTQPDDSEAKQTPQSITLDCPQLEGGESRLFYFSTNIDSQYGLGWGMANSNLKIRGIVEYEDGVWIKRRTGFLRTYDVTLGCFRKSGDAEEEYED